MRTGLAEQLLFLTRFDWLADEPEVKKLKFF